MRTGRLKCTTPMIGARLLVYLVLVCAAAVDIVETVNPAALPGTPATSVLGLETTPTNCGSNQCVQRADGNADAEEDLVTWATANHRFQPRDRVRSDVASDSSPRPPADTQLLIGVKTAVIEGFSSRQLLRQTWADPARLPDGVFVVFLGCEPSTSRFNYSHEEHQWQDALHMEKATYKDLLTSELGCYDSYFTLVDKVKGFFRWTAAAVTSKSLEHLAHVMLVDDDVFVRVDKLVESLHTPTNPSSKPKGYYAGEVLAVQLRQTLGIGRDPEDKNAVPYAEFPMRHKPPFATGAHYVLSLDLVQFMARNDRFLKGVGTLEDVSVAYWLRSLMQIKPLHMTSFDNVRYTLCQNSLIAYGDVTKQAIRQMDTNLRTNRSLCRGFSFTQWDKRVFEPAFPRVPQSDQRRVHHQLTYHWHSQFNSTGRELIVVAKISVVETNESISAVFSPAKIGFAFFCAPLIDRIHHNMPRVLLAAAFCDEVNEHLHAMLRQSAQDAPATAHLHMLPLSNMKHGANSALILVRLTPRALQWITLVECLMASIFPDAFVSIESEHAYATWLKDYPPDFVFAAVEDLIDRLAPQGDSTNRRVHGASGVTHALNLPSTTRLVLLELSTRLPPATLESHQNRAIVISATVPTDRKHSHLYLPIASSSFAHRIHDSPRALLQSTANPEFGSLPIAVGFCVCEGERNTERSQLRREFVAELTALGVSSAPDFCVTSQAPHAAFPHDADVERCRQYKFAVVFENYQDTSGYIGHHIVSAFLAGSIPIYYGYSPTASWLFNPKAFVDCRTFDSITECAAHVARVHASTDLYEAMRREAPVVNHTAFMEVFSWHPDATNGSDAGNHLERSYTVGHRFRDILLDV